jgi:hypothetical protein
LIAILVLFALISLVVKVAEPGSLVDPSNDKYVPLDQDLIAS